MCRGTLLRNGLKSDVPDRSVDLAWRPPRWRS